MSRNDAFAMVDAGRALSRYDARPWASTLRVPAASLITTQDRLVRPSKQRALAAALDASRRELAADHFVTLSQPVEFAAVTVELVELVARQRASTTGASSPSPDVAWRSVELTTEELDRLPQVAELVLELLAGDDVGQHQAHAGDLPGEELGVGLRPFGDVAVELGLHPVARLLAVLGQQDQRCGVRRLQRQHQGQQHEAAVPRVELQRLRRHQVPRRSRRR